MVAKSHFHRLTRSFKRFREDGFLTDCSILTKQGSIDMHKIILFTFSAYMHEIHQDSKNGTSLSIGHAEEYEQEDVEKLVNYLYSGEISSDKTTGSIIKSLYLDLSVDIGTKKKKVPTGESVKKLVNLELKYLRNLTFEMEIPKFSQTSCVHTDIDIRVETEVYPCHKLVLSACSKYFEVMFTSGMKETSDNEINLHGVSPGTFVLVKNYMYTGNISATTSNVQDILSTAVYLQMEDLQTLCEDFMLHQIDVDNCVDMWSLGSAYSCPMLSCGAWKFIVDHFNKVSQIKLMRTMKHDDMKRLLSNDCLNVEDEKDVLKSVLQWVSTKQQMDKMVDLLQSVRLSLIETEYLKDVVENNKVILQNKSAVEMIQDILSNTENNICHERSRKEKVFIVIKRSSYTSGIETAAYSLSQKKWYSLQTLTNCAGGTGFSTCVTGDSIYVTGGTATPRGNFRYSLEDNKWTEEPDILEGRSSHCSGYVEGSLFVLGGSDVSLGSFNILSSIEKYDHVDKCWKKVGEMEIPTYDSASAVAKSRILIFGGSMGLTSGVYIKDIQCFDTITNTSTVIYHYLPFTLSLAMACSNNRDIYITCPNGKTVHYNEEEMPCILNENKGLQLMGFATLYHESAIFIMGGYSTTGESEAVHRCDLTSKKAVPQMTQIKLPFKKQSNQLYAVAKNISRRFLNEDNVLENAVRGLKVVSSR